MTPQQVIGVVGSLALVAFCILRLRWPNSEREQLLSTILIFTVATARILSLFFLKPPDVLAMSGIAYIVILAFALIDRVR